MKANLQRRMLASSLLVVVAGVAFVLSATSGRAGAQSYYREYPREQTLITLGTQWGEIQGFNPYRTLEGVYPISFSYAVGTVGLCYETLLRYDPLKDRYINWLAKSARFSGKKTYVVVIRNGVKWSNGQKFTAKDVAWNFRLGRFDTAFWHNLYSSLKSIKTPTVKTKVWVKIKVKGKTKFRRKLKRVRDRVVLTFKGTPNYIQWQHLIWNLPMINPGQARAQIQGPKSLIRYDPKNPIGTGPYTLDLEGYDPAIRVVWKKKKIWWAAKQKLAPSPGPKYVIDLVNGITSVGAFAGLLTGLEDLSNNYLPGIEGLVAQGKAQTYYPSAPYHLSANTAWLTPNATHKPLDDPAFRKALASSIDVDKIVKDDFRGQVLRATSTGLLPTWKKWIAGDLAASKGFSYDLSRAKSMLEAAGYKDVNSDGYVENKNGTAIDLKFQVPMGWSDWEQARDLIIASAAQAGIRIHKLEGDYDAYASARNSGSFDLIIDNTPQLSDHPWTYFDFLFRLPIADGGAGQMFANFQRYENQEAWRLVRQLDKTSPSKTARRKALVRRLQDIFLTDLPNIPLWYNGIWAQSQSRYWTNWPSATSKRNYVPSMWRGYLQMTGVDFIAHLKQAPSAPPG